MCRKGPYVGAYQFDPAADRLAVATIPTRLAVRPGRTGFPTARPTPSQPALVGPTSLPAGPADSSGPFDIRMLDPATGATLWNRTAVDECTDTRDGSPATWDSLFHLLFSPSGRLLVGFRDATHTFRVWVGRTATGEVERTLATATELQTSPVRRMALDRDGRRVAVIGGGEVRVWDLETGTLVATLRGHDSPVSAVALNADGTRLFALHAEYRKEKRVGVRIGVWDLETARLVLTVQPPDAILLSRMDRAGGVTLSDPGGIEFRDGQLSVRLYPLDWTFDGTPVKP